jgi:creatinine amidohydrolase
MLHLHPELVRRDKLRDFPSLAQQLADKEQWLGAEKPMGFGWKAQDLNPAGVCGNAARADAQRGKAYLAHVAGAFAELLKEVAQAPLGLIADAEKTGSK